MIRSTFPIRKTMRPVPTVTLLPALPSSTTRDAILAIHEVQGVIEQLNTFKEQMAAEHAAKLEEISQTHQAHMQVIDGHVADAKRRVSTILKGEKGDKGDTVQGEPGKPGKNAPPVDLEKLARQAAKLIPPPEKGKDAIAPDIEAIVEEIKKKKLLKAEHIAGFTEEMASYRNQLAGKHYGSTTMARGGGDRVAAGTNVTITDSNGVRTISATSGGVTTLSATETPNGNIKIFTFAAASAQPSFIIADNVWLKATSAAGTVNWTWNNGTKKATLTVPPTDEIYGVV